MAHRPPTTTWIALAVVLACAVYSALTLQVSSGITQFAIEPDDARLGPWLARLATSEPARTMVVSFVGDSLSTSQAAAREFAAELADHEEVESIRTGPDPALGERIYEAFFPRRFRFVDRDATAIAARFTDPALAASAQRVRVELSRPTGAGLKRLVPTDPWLLFVDRTQAFRRGYGDSLAVDNGQFVTPDRSHAIVFLTTRHGPFEGHHQAPLEDAIEAERVAVAAQFGVVVERSALHRFAVESERTIRAEVQWLSTLSSIGVVTMLLLAFRRLGALALTLVPMLAGVTVATAVTLMVSGQIHAMTLAFGTTLVGVCVDYPVHLITHHGLCHDRDAALAAVWPALVLGALTTVVGFAALAVFGLPGVREMGLFAAVGVATALGATRWLVAPWLPKPRIVDFSARAAAALDRVIDRLAARRWAVATATVGALIVAFAGWSRTHWVDDARALNSSLPAVSDQDARVRALVGGNDVGRVLIAQGRTVDDAAAVQDRLWTALGEPTGAQLRSSAPVLWSRAVQDENLAEVRGVPNLIARTHAALATAGFRPEAFAALDTVTHNDPGALDHAALVDAGLGDLVRPFVVDTAEGVALLSFAADADPLELAAVAERVEGATFFDQRVFTERLYREHRRSSLFAVALGLLVVIVVLTVRYRSAALVAAALVPALVAAGAALGILGWFGVELQMLHLVACLLVLSMGVDYGVFLVESVHTTRGRGAAALGVVVACATTVLAFGVLGASSNPALAALGITTAIGVVLAALGAPLSLVLAGPRAVAEERPR